MSVLRISRLNILRNGTQPALLANYSDDGSKKGDPSKDDPSTDKKDERLAVKKKAVASDRLSALLAEMSTDSNLSLIKDVVRPRSAAEKKERLKQLSSVSQVKAPKPISIAEAAKEVAATLGGDTKKTESELLEKLMKGETTSQNLSSLLGGMQIDKGESKPFERRSDIVRKSSGQRRARENQEGMQQPNRRDQPRPFKPSGVRVNVDLFGGQKLGVFTSASDLQETPDILPTWDYLQNRELNLAVTHPPRNYFEKMALWTEQGKLWKFPIDNEQGMDDEAKNYFTEHIFLEQHLESWCPTKGPVRHFMELVCVGLSKNPYYTVTQKREHIEWYRDYFADKKELLASVIIDADTPKELQQ